MPEHALAHQFDDSLQQREAASFGMWVFLMTEVLFFGVLFAAYTITRVGFPEAFADASRHTDVILGTLETAILLSSSLTMALGVRAVRLNMHRLSASLLAATIAFGVLFLALHGVEYYHEYGEGLFPGANFIFEGGEPRHAELFFYLYYVMTGFHGLHVTIGICIIAAVAWQVWRRRYNSRYFNPVEVTGLYWHLVDIVWIFLYPLIYLVARS